MKNVFINGPNKLYDEQCNTQFENDEIFFNDTDAMGINLQYQCIIGIAELFPRLGSY